MITPFLNNISSDLLRLSPLGIDYNSDGVSDGWSFTTGGTASKFVASNEQELRITASTLNTERTKIGLAINATSGKPITLSATGRVSGNVRMILNIDWYNGASYISSSTGSYSTSAIDVLLSLRGVAPINSTRAICILNVYPINNGNIGSAFFKNARAIRI